MNGKTTKSDIGFKMIDDWQECAEKVRMKMQFCIDSDVVSNYNSNEYEMEDNEMEDRNI
jgi:hypothetical protein